MATDSIEATISSHTGGSSARIKMIKKWIKSVVNPLGIDIVKYPLTPLGRHLREFIKNSEVNLVVDVGACDGGFCRLLRTQADYHGPIRSFEPCMKTFQAVRQKMAADRNWRGFQVGLSDGDTEGVLHAYEDNADFNSLLVLREKDAA